MERERIPVATLRRETNRPVRFEHALEKSECCIDCWLGASDATEEAAGVRASAEQDTIASQHDYWSPLESLYETRQDILDIAASDILVMEQSDDLVARTLEVIHDWRPP
jgi:hypothetical protein